MMSPLLASLLRALRSIVVAAVFFFGRAAPRRLPVKMYNAKTDTTLTCSGRQGTIKELEPLYDAVEACVRQLEARGFVRVEGSPGP